MDFWKTVLVLVRRWYITVPAFFASLALAATAYLAMPVQYQSHSVLVVTTPLAGGTEETRARYPGSLTNPLFMFDRSVSLTASIVIQQMSSPEIAQDLGITPGGAVNYDISNGSSNPELLESGPFIFVQGYGPSPEEAQDVVDAVAALATRILDSRQTALGAPASTHMTLHEVVPTTTGEQLKGSPLRAAVAAGALACLASLAAAFGFESMMTSRRRHRIAGAPAEGPRPDVSAEQVPIGAPGMLGDPAAGERRR